MKQIFETFMTTLDFSSRLSRKDFWLYYASSLATFFVSVTLLAMVENSLSIGLRPVENALALIFTIANVSAGIRRMHDIGKSGWFILIPIANIYFWLQPTNKEA